MNQEETFVIINHCKLFTGFTDEEKSKVSQELRVSIKSYRKQETVILEGDLLRHIYLVESGSVIGQKFQIEGEVHLLNVFEKGDVIGLEVFGSTMKTSPLTYVAGEDAKVTRISIASLRSCTYREKLFENIIRLLSDDNIRNTYKIEILSKRGLQDRILTYFKIMEHKRKSNPFDIGMNQEQLAQYLCVNRSALSNELNKMKKGGLIDYRGHKYTLKKNN